MTRRPVLLAGLIGLAVVLRLAAIVAADATHARAEENRQIARNLRAGRGFTFTQFGVTGPTACRGPAYPMLLAVLGPDDVGLILAVNVLAGAAAVVAAFDLVRQLTPATAPPWTAAALVAVWPTQVYAATLTQGLSPAVALLLASLAVAVRHAPAARITAGLLGGLATLTEPILALPLLLAVPLLPGRQKTLAPIFFRACTGETARTAAPYLAAALVLVAPWLYRNAITFDGPMPLTSNVWRDAFYGNGDDATGETHVARAVPAVVGRPPDLQTRVDRLAPPDYDRLKRPEPERTAWMGDVTRLWIATHPVRYAALVLRRTAMSLGVTPFEYGPTAGPVYWSYDVLRAVEAFGYFGLLWRACRGPGGRVTIALLAGLLIIPALTLAEIRQAVLLDIPLLLGGSLAFVRRPARAA